MEEVHPLPSPAGRALEEDPLTGLPNAYAFLLDMPDLMASSCGTVFLATVGQPETPSSHGSNSVDVEALREAASIFVALAQAQPTGGQVYRIGERELAAVIPHKPGNVSPDPFPLPACPCDHTVCVIPRPPLVVRRISYPSQAGSIEELLESMVFRVRAGDKGDFSQEDLARKFRETFRLLRETLELVYIDDISGLPNHRAARYLIKRALRSGDKRPLSLMLVDGDHLRVYNDNLGYQAGHELIRKLGFILTTKVSPGETVTRWLSGDEFMLVLPGVSRKEAFARAQDICLTVARATAGWIYPVTVSVGVASFPDDAGSEPELIKKAEEANSVAKRQGKNRASYPPL